jgi:hypothetical protein
VEMWASRDVDDYLAELLRLEGRGDAFKDYCPQCTTGSADYRCMDCFGTDLLCSSCIVLRHRSDPFHRIQVRFFKFSVLLLALTFLQLGSTALEWDFLSPCFPEEPRTQDPAWPSIFQALLEAPARHERRLLYASCQRHTRCLP